MRKSKSVNNLNDLYNIRINNFLHKDNDFSKSYSMDSLFDILDDDELNHNDISKILKQCTYICDVCKNDYMFKCIECEAAKQFEYEVEKQRYTKSMSKKSKQYFSSLNDLIDDLL